MSLHIYSHTYGTFVHTYLRHICTHIHTTHLYMHLCACMTDLQSHSYSPHGKHKKENKIHKQNKHTEYLKNQTLHPYLIAMPLPHSCACIHHLQHPIPKTRLPECRIHRLTSRAVGAIGIKHHTLLWLIGWRCVVCTAVAALAWLVNKGDGQSFYISPIANGDVGRATGVQLIVEYRLTALICMGVPEVLTWWWWWCGCWHVVVVWLMMWWWCGCCVCV